MTVYFMRLFLYTLLPLLIGAIVNRVDNQVQSRSQRLEVYLLYLFALGVTGSGIGGFFGHFFFPDVVAESIGWEIGSPFQLEIAFANLALGVMGLIAIGRRDGFREATVIAVTVFGVGASIVHFIDIAQTGNLAPGNTLQNFSNLVKPALLIGFLQASRKTGASDDLFESRRIRHSQAAGWMTGMAAAGFGLGFGFNRPVIGTALGVIMGAIMMLYTLRGGRQKN